MSEKAPCHTPLKKGTKRGLPWYRYPYVWILLIIVPLFTLMASIATVYIAVSSTESEPHESYYKRGLSPNELAPREEKARQLNLSAHLEVSPTQITVTFEQPLETDDLVIKFQHPTLEKHDFSQPLAATSDASKVFQLKVPDNLRSNKWDIFVDSPQQGWRIKGRLLDYEQSIMLTPFGQ